MHSASFRSIPLPIIPRMRWGFTVQGRPLFGHSGELSYLLSAAISFLTINGEIPSLLATSAGQPDPS